METNKLIKQSYLAQRRYIGIMGLLLPLLCWASCLLIPDKPTGWWYSMSATYHNSPILSMGLAVVASFLFTYKGYDISDRYTNRISAISALIVALVPCSVYWINEPIGILYLQPNISDTIHSFAAILLFSSFIFNILVNFRKSHDKYHKIWYTLIGALMIFVTIVFACENANHEGSFKVFWYETIELILFGTAWLIKGKFLQKA